MSVWGILSDVISVMHGNPPLFQMCDNAAVM